MAIAAARGDSAPAGASDDSSLFRITAALPLLALIAVACVAAFFPVLRAGFLEYDDPLLVTGNLLLRKRGFDGFIEVLTTPQYRLYHPLVTLTFWIEYGLVGLNPFLYHLTNLLGHILAAWVALFLGRALFREEFIALAGALLFAVHPLRVESVAWVVERKDVLMAIFFLGSLLAWCRWRDTARAGLYWLALSLQVASLLCKPMALTFPALLWLIDWFRRGSPPPMKEFAIRVAPFAVAAVGFAVLTIVLHFPGADSGCISEVTGPASHWGPLQASLAPFYCIAEYIRLWIIPYPLTLERGYLGAFPYGVDAGVVSVGALGLAVIALAFFAYRRNPLAAFCIFSYLVSLAPVSQVIPVGKDAAPADRYTYIPTLYIGFLAVAEFAKRVASTTTRNTTLAVLTLLCAGASFVRSADWHSSETLWRSTLRHRPESSVAWGNLGAAQMQRGDLAAAEKSLRRALELDPRNPEANSTFAGLLFVSGRVQESVAYADRALEVCPRFADAWNNRAAAMMQLRQPEEASKSVENALASNPALSSAWLTRGHLADMAGDHKLAMDYYTRALTFDPTLAEAWFSRAQTLIVLGRSADALNDARRAVALQPADPDFNALLRQLSTQR